MDFGFSQEISADVIKKGDIITVLSERAKTFFKTKEYGFGIKVYTVGIICVAPGFEFFFKEQKKYTKTKRMLEYDVKLDHIKFRDADNKEIYEMIWERVIKSLNIIQELRIEDFDLSRFKEDLERFFEENIDLGKTQKFNH